jgi:hypothetical protein
MVSFTTSWKALALYQGTTLQAAEKLNRSQVLYQGTTSVVPQVQQNQRGL